MTMLTRRGWLKTLPLLPSLSQASAAPAELHCDVAIVGGGLGGVAAALAALRNGLRAVLTEETDWIGGQLTSQAVPPDEHPWIEQFGCTASYRDYRNGVRAYYRKHFPLTAEASAQPRLNPGNGSVSRLTHEPRVSLAVLQAMLAPYLRSGQLTLLLEHIPDAAETTGDRVNSVIVRDRQRGTKTTLSAQYFLDATELGDLLPLANVEHVTGAEPQSRTGELHATAAGQPGNVQSFTFCFAMDYLPGEDHVIAKPAGYNFWRDYRPQLTPPWPGRLLDWTASDPRALSPRTAGFRPDGGTLPPGTLNFWTYRRIADRANFTPGAYLSDITLVNWPQNDYWLGDLIGSSPEQRQAHLQRAKDLSFSLLYWMQTEAPRPDGGYGWKGLRLRPGIVGTDDGMAKAPYIRESRRIQAEFTVLEQHVGTEMRIKSTGQSRAEAMAEIFPDSVGVGCYRIDLHPSANGSNYVDVGSLPFQIPLGALIPKRMQNLLPACKNLGTTHISNGCYRLHPVEWNIGEAAGALAAFAIRRKTLPRAVRSSPRLLADFQKFLEAQGFELSWPRIGPV